MIRLYWLAKDRAELHFDSDKDAGRLMHAITQAMPVGIHAATIDGVGITVFVHGGYKHAPAQGDKP